MSKVHVGEIDQEFIRKFGRVLTALQIYHRYELFGAENIPKSGRALLLVNHSFATYDIFLMGYQVYIETGRASCGLGDSKLFALKWTRSFMEKLRAFEAGPKVAQSLLEAEQLVVLAPGGMREALRPSTEKEHVIWQKRQGFVRLAIKTQSPVILCACPNADRIFNIYPSFLTKWTYKKFKLPFVVGRGIGPTPIPRPVRLFHNLSEAIMPPKISEEDPSFEGVVGEFHKKLIGDMEELLKVRD